MKIIIRRVTEVEHYGTALVRVGTVDIPDATAAGSIPDVAMRMFVQQQGGQIADGVYETTPLSQIARRRNTTTATSRLTPEASPS